MNALTLLALSSRPTAELYGELEAELLAANAQRRQERPVQIFVAPDGSRQIVLTPRLYTERVVLNPPHSKRLRVRKESLEKDRGYASISEALMAIEVKRL